MINLKLITSILMLAIAAFSQDTINTIGSTTDTTTLGIKKDFLTIKHDLTGFRSKTSISGTVLSNLQELRYAYNKRLKDKPGLKGKISIKFAINQFGNVIFCGVIESSLKDALLEIELTEIIKKWKFEKIDKPGDVTEVVYPFVFDQDGTTIKLGGRSKASIMKVVLANLSEIKNVYNKRLLENPKLGGKIYFKFAINEFGSVIFCKIDSSTVKDDILENQVTELIKKWQFNKIDKPGDVTEVVYPFVFAPGSTSNKFGITIFSLLLSLCVLLPVIILTQK